jgi:hypothetical protein
MSSFNIVFRKKKDSYKMNFTMFDQSWSMTLQHFCSTLRLAYGAIYDIMRDSMKSSLEEFCVDNKQMVGSANLNYI